MTASTKTLTSTKRPRRMAREPKADTAVGQGPAESSEPSGPAKSMEPVGRADKPQTKTDLILGLLGREEGATLEQLVAAIGWLPHTTRAALTGISARVTC